MSDRNLLEEVTSLKQRLERYIAESEEEKILRILTKLDNLNIAFECLRETGIGKVVNKLRKCDGEIGDLSKRLVLRWKETAEASHFSLTEAGQTQKSPLQMRESRESFVPAPSTSSGASRSKRKSPSPGPSHSTSSKRTQQRDPPAACQQPYNILADLPDLLHDDRLMHYLNQPLHPSTSSSVTFTEERNTVSANGTSGRAFTRIRMFAGKAKARSVTQKVPKLLDLCNRVLMDNINNIEEMGPVPYHVIKPVLDACSPAQLRRIEGFNAHLVEDTDELWRQHCEREFRITQLDEDEEEDTFRDTYRRKIVEREQKLRSLTDSINKNTKAREAPVRQTKLAFVDTKLLAKGPRIPRGAVGPVEPIGIKAKLKQMNVPAAPSRSRGRGMATSSVVVATAVRPQAGKSGPLMQKSLKAFKTQFKR